MATKTTRVITSWFFEILAVIILVLLANLLARLTPSSFIDSLVSFLNSNILLIILISFLFFLGALIYIFGFPANLLAPVFDAFGSVFLVKLLINLIIFIEGYSKTNVGAFLSANSMIVYILVFIIVLAFGLLYVSRREKRPHHVVEEEIIEEEPEEPVIRKRRVIRRRVRRR